MDIILFVYGLSFFALGINVLLVPTRNSEIFFANKIWLLGIFAILHAFVEWIVLYMFLYPNFEAILTPIKVILLLGSYLFLFEFSRFIARESFKNSLSKLRILYVLYSAPIIYATATTILILLIVLDPTWSGAITATRYTYGFFGSFLLGIGLYFYGDSLKKSQYTDQLKIYFKMPGIAFIIYAILAGVFVSPNKFFTANIINTELFLEVTGIPVQLLRALCALVISVCSLKALQIFNHETEEKLRQSLTRVKQFSSDVSHELKTPITVIKGQIEVALRESRTEQEYKNTLKSNLEEVNKLESVITNLLLLSYLEKESLKNKFTPNSLDDILLSAIDELIVIANNKGINIEIKSLDIIKLGCDSGLLKAVFKNLIENSIKYSPSYSTISISLTKSKKFAKFYLEDQGVGIDPQKLPYIFERFYRADTSRSKHIKGYGLGLALAKQIVELHQGKITIQNRDGKGIKAEILLPINI